MRVLVLGATGFIGRALCRQLLASGRDVRALVRVLPQGDRGSAALPDGVEVARGDLAEPQSIAAAAAGVDAVVHAAGIVSPRAAPEALRWTLVAGTENVVNALVHAEVQRLVYVSCADVSLMDADRINWDEARDPPWPPLGTRARALALAEAIAVSGGGMANRLFTVALRPSFVWGPGDTSRLPHLIAEAREAGLPLFGRGRHFFSTTYIDHVVDAVELALQAGDEARGRPFYLADGDLIESHEFFSRLCAATDMRPPRRGPWLSSRRWSRRLGFSPSAPYEEAVQRARATHFNTGAAARALGFEPRVSVEEGMRRLHLWVAAQGGADALAARARTPPGPESVQHQVEAARRG